MVYSEEQYNRKKEISSFFKTIVREGILLYENELYNDAASRAYYAMHHAAKAALLMKDIDITSHKALISKFGESFIKIEIPPYHF